MFCVACAPRAMMKEQCELFLNLLAIKVVVSIATCQTEENKSISVK